MHLARTSTDPAARVVCIAHSTPQRSLSGSPRSSPGPHRGQRGAQPGFHPHPHTYVSIRSGGNEPQPAIMILPGHGTIAQTVGLERSPQRANAKALARGGLITLTPEYRGFGRLGALDHLQIDATAQLVRRTWLGPLVEDAING